MKVSMCMFGPTAHGETPAKTARTLKSVGVNELVYFTSLYHGYRLLQPRFPSRAIYTLETDRVFWDADPAFYKDSSVKPRKSDDFGDKDNVLEMITALHKEGIAFSPLVPMCAAESLVQERPDLAVENLYGAKDRLFLCYNNPDVRAYRFSMVRELAERYAIDHMMLDKIPQIMLEQNAFNGIFDPPLRTVGSFCFCRHCVARASQSEIDLNEIRQRSLAIAQRSLDLPPWLIAAQGAKLIGDTEMPLLLLEEPLLYAMLQFRFETAVEFVNEIRAILKRIRPKADLQAAFVPPSHVGHDMTSPRSWMTTQSYQKYRGALDEIFCCIHAGPDIVRFEVARAVAAAEGKLRVVASLRLYGQTRPEEVAAMCDGALAAGSDGVSLLGYDVTSDSLLQALKAWVKTVKN
jgi:hypothetical protein